MPKLLCDMTRACDRPVTHVDRDGYIYCTAHAAQRRAGHYGVPCRRLTSAEMQKLERGELLKRY